ncbi:excinuclease ABC subunit UvrC [bacterium]|nr:excinuclease ABC subunit UvrC [bacterium]
MDYIKKKLALVPNKPGCYQMKNKDGVIIYVGKAKKLKNRLSSYFRGTHTGKTARLVSEIVDFEYVVVGSEKESLILENNLIKKYDPKYNILLRDDKSYPYIELTNDEYPRLSIVRSLNKKGNGNLYGPYPNVTAARNTVNLLNRMYPLRKCTTFNKKPCLYYHIKECLGYCTNQVDSNEMEQMRKEIVTFLKGDYEIITKKIEKEMLEQSEKMNYEKALELKELSDYIKVTLAKQKVEIREQIDIDIFGYYVNKGYLSIQIFFIRGGKIVERHSKIIPLIDEVDAELTRYIVDVYQNNFLLPKEILVPDIVDAELISNYYSISCRVPIRGEKLRLIEMANKNAKITLDNEFELLEKDENRTYVANQELKQILNLNRLERIELFDNSHLFGTYSVSGMVVFIDGKPAKNEYRKYKIKVDTNDEYGMMREVIYRRYFRVLKDQLTKPDLIIVDGGIGQIHIAREVIESLGLHIPVVGLKKDDHHTTDSLLGFNPIQTIKIDKKSNLFYFLERMQDEVHNFTIHYHQQIRSKGTLSSVLDTVEGIGSVRKKELLKKYKTLSKMKEASLDELKLILPETVAINLQDFLKNY